LSLRQHYQSAIHNLRCELAYQKHQWFVSPPMATPNCSTYGRSNCSRQDRVDYDYSGLTAMRAAASLRR
jgi:hypothetical protein